MTTIGFIGAGNMASAIIKGISGSALAKELEVYVTDIDLAKAQALSQYGAKALTSGREVAEKCRYVVLVVKPQQLDGVLRDIADCVTPDTVLISNCAGISGAFIKSRVGESAKVVLVMPNTPLFLGAGATAMSFAEPTTRAEFEFARAIYAACGIVEEVPYDRMKEVIAINGSSPAFIYLFVRGFIEYGASVGLSADAVMRLFSQTLIGSAKMMTESGMTVEELIKQVSSPGGTTLAGLEELYRGDLTGVVDKACKACTKRAYELGGE